MKKMYISPELELLRFRLTGDVLRDSVPEATDNPYVPEPDPDDPFGDQWD